MKLPEIVVASSILLAINSWAGPDNKHTALSSPFAEFVEPGFPFFSSTFDARDLGPEWPADNLTPRAIILDLGHGIHACFDTDLLRIALVWKESPDGEWLTMNSMASGSYRLPSQKTPIGQKHLPKPIGTPLLANGNYPGWTIGEQLPGLIDPREPTPQLYEGQKETETIGLGPLPLELGRWGGIRLIQGGVIFEYEIDSVKVKERIAATSEGEGVLFEWVIAPHKQTFNRIVGIINGKPIFHRISPSEIEVKTTFFHEISPEAKLRTAFSRPKKWNDVTWTEEIAVKGQLSESNDAYVIDRIPQPIPNPWKRNVRLAAMDFLPDGRMAIVTYDGDVWLVSGLTGNLQNVTWKRFASGLHEPMGLQVVAGSIYVSDRNGIVKLHDEDKDGQADFYENFSNIVPQTAETREFAMDLVKNPGGGFIIAKGGQTGTAIGNYNGCVIEVSKDGRSFKLLGSGFRQPYIGCDPVTGVVTASDQQGNWIPATPVHIVEKANHYGFLPEIIKSNVHPKKITEPIVWIPHFANQSGASHVWLRNAKMGPLNDSLIHIGYSRPQLFKVHIDDTPGGPMQGAVSPIINGFFAATMKGVVNPADGQLYVCGFKIFGTVAGELSGLHRVRWTGKPSYVPEDVRSSDKGILLRFGIELQKEVATSPQNYTIDRWNYRRTKDYGSGNYKPNGEPGQESLRVANAYLSKDSKAVFLAIPDMKPSHSLSVTYRLAAKTDLPQIKTSYLTVHGLKKMDLAKEGFGNLKVDLTLKKGTALTVKEPDPSIEEGKKVHQLYGCMACHSIDDSPAKPLTPEQVVGPGWKGLWGKRRLFSDGTLLKKVNGAYIKESILDPNRNIVEGFNQKGDGMPPYLGVLKDYQIESIVLYIKSLAD